MQDVSATVAFLRTDSISILHAIAVELPDVFGAEVLPRLDLRDTLNLAQTSTLFRDTVWSVRGVQSMRAKIVACLLYTSPSPRDRQKSRMPSSA